MKYKILHFFYKGLSKNCTMCRVTNIRQIVYILFDNILHAALTLKVQSSNFVYNQTLKKDLKPSNLQNLWSKYFFKNQIVETKTRLVRHPVAPLLNTSVLTLRCTAIVHGTRNKYAAYLCTYSRFLLIKLSHNFLDPLNQAWLKSRKHLSI